MTTTAATAFHLVATAAAVATVAAAAAFHLVAATAATAAPFAALFGGCRHSDRKSSDAGGE
jgi:hypothetical protein